MTLDHQLVRSACRSFNVEDSPAAIQAKLLGTTACQISKPMGEFSALQVLIFRRASPLVMSS